MTELRIRNVSKSFGGKHVLENFSGILPASSFTILKGSNGSGKTTLLKIIAGLITEDKGLITYADSHIRKSNIQISYCANNYRSFFQRISCLDNLLYFGCINGIGKKDILNSIYSDFSFFELDQFIEKPFNQISLGQVQMLILTRALMIKPKIILVDEVGSNIDDQKLSGLNQFLTNYLKKNNSIILMATHNFYFELDGQNKTIKL